MHPVGQFVAGTSSLGGEKSQAEHAGNDSGNWLYHWKIPASKLCASPYYSVVLNESTDLSTVKQLGLVVQYLDTQVGIPQTSW